MDNELSERPHRRWANRAEVIGKWSTRHQLQSLFAGSVPAAHDGTLRRLGSLCSALLRMRTRLCRLQCWRRSRGVADFGSWRDCHHAGDYHPARVSPSFLALHHNVGALGVFSRCRWTSAFERPAPGARISTHQRRCTAS